MPILDFNSPSGWKGADKRRPQTDGEILDWRAGRLSKSNTVIMKHFSNEQKMMVWSHRFIAEISHYELFFCSLSILEKQNTEQEKWFLWRSMLNSNSCFLFCLSFTSLFIDNLLFCESVSLSGGGAVRLIKNSRTFGQ